MGEAIGIPRNFSNLAVINLPCCLPVPNKYLSLEVSPNTFVDNSVLSPKRTFFVWKNFNLSKI
jgi:hypothetical protein